MEKIALDRNLFHKKVSIKEIFGSKPSTPKQISTCLSTKIPRIYARKPLVSDSSRPDLIHQKESLSAYYWCRDPGLNWGPFPLQGNALPTELSRHRKYNTKK